MLPTTIKAMMYGAEVVALSVSAAIKMKSLTVIHESQRLLLFRKPLLLRGSCSGSLLIRQSRALQ
jgi:hypothetical protein